MIVVSQTMLQPLAAISLNIDMLIDDTSVTKAQSIFLAARPNSEIELTEGRQASLYLVSIPQYRYLQKTCVGVGDVVHFYGDHGGQLAAHYGES
jgi:hypothetical protein